ncbi:MAG: hypothetical protein WBV71_05620, partial [Roseobacter sp.]
LTVPITRVGHRPGRTGPVQAGRSQIPASEQIKLVPTLTARNHLTHLRLVCFGNTSVFFHL